MDTAEFDDIGFVAYAQTEGHGLKGMGILAGFLILYELVSKASPPFHFQIDDRLLFSESLRLLRRLCGSALYSEPGAAHEKQRLEVPRAEVETS